MSDNDDTLNLRQSGTYQVQRGRRDTHERIHRLETELRTTDARLVGVPGGDGGAIGELTQRVSAAESGAARIVKLAIALAIASVGALGGGLSLLQRSAADHATRDERIRRLERDVQRLEDRLVPGPTRNTP